MLTYLRLYAYKNEDNHAFKLREEKSLARDWDDVFVVVHLFFKAFTPKDRFAASPDALAFREVFDWQMSVQKPSNRDVPVHPH